MAHLVMCEGGAQHAAAQGLRLGRRAQDCAAGALEVQQLAQASQRVDLRARCSEGGWGAYARAAAGASPYMGLQ